MQPGHFLKSPSYFSGPELNIQNNQNLVTVVQTWGIAIHRINHYSSGQVLGKPIGLSSG